MKANELISLLRGGALSRHSDLYADIPRQTERYIEAIRRFTELYGDGRELTLFSVPGRSEISGNHTDHNRGKVLAGAIDRDIIAVAAKTDDGCIRLTSEGYGEDVVPLASVGDPEAFPDARSASLIAGVANGLAIRGEAVGGFVAYTTTEVLKGSGLSSSAAFEVMIGNILNHLFCDGRIDNVELAKIAQYAENVYFGKPCGLMDQTACAVGGFVAIDFESPTEPVITPIPFSFAETGYQLIIVDTGGNHADLTPDYAAVPAEMRAVAACFGREVLRGISEAEITARARELRERLGDRHLLRALHFVRENIRVEKQAEALLRGDFAAFLSGVLASGDSSYKYLQNVYTTANPSEQGLSLALALTDGMLSGKDCAWRVHGGGFAGTIQVFVRGEYAKDYVCAMNSVFGQGAAMPLSIRPRGAVRIEL